MTPAFWNAPAACDTVSRRAPIISDKDSWVKKSSLEWARSRTIKRLRAKRCGTE
jgi:hypothetical protein